MPKATALPAWQRAIIVLTGTVVGVVVLACLYFGQSIFMPVALAIFLTFLLSPLVTKLQRCGLGRVPSVIVVVLLSAIVLTGGGYIIGRQLVSLVEGLSQYSDNMKAKANNLRQMGESEWARKLGKIVEEINDVLSGKAPPPVDDGAQKKEPDSTTSTTQPQTVIVRQTESTPPWLARASSAAGSVTESLVQALLTGVLVIFMLLKREDMRNRLLRLAGHGRLTAMTKAVDEAGQRVSRFLVTQAVINILYGLVLSFGLFLIGIDHALLWGFLVALMRYIPYVGIWIGALPPILLSLAQFPGWWHPALVFALFLVLELVTSNLLEPRFFGQSIGVSEVALLVAAAFWGWMWGPIGLVLSSPLTVVLVVMGKYIPNLEFLDVLLGDEPPLDPKISYYQRLLARDQDEAAQLVQEQAKVLSPEHVYDELLIPTLSYVKRDRENNNLDDVDEAFILHATQEIVEDLGELKERKRRRTKPNCQRKKTRGTRRQSWIVRRRRFSASLVRTRAMALLWRCFTSCWTRRSGIWRSPAPKRCRRICWRRRSRKSRS